MLRNTYQHLITICLFGVMLTMIISPKRSSVAQQLPDIKIEQMEISISRFSASRKVGPFAERCKNRRDPVLPKLWKPSFS
ncbi:TPA: hypothetical protein EYP66_03735 [Candidatus Poribacteria bacterium]|nr:hypothetical protein [Candidatus Poribacteria bacterium]